MAEDRKSKLVIAQVSPCVDDELKLEMVEIFLESRRHSGGGEIKSIERINGESTMRGTDLLRVEFSDADAKRRVLDHRFLQVGPFTMRVFDPDIKTGWIHF